MAGPLLPLDAIRLGCRARDRWEAVTIAGRVLVEVAAVEEPYVASMLERERALSTYVGNGVAIPHGTDAGRAWVRRPCLAFLQFPDGVDWDGPVVRAVVAIAAAGGEEHLTVLTRLAEILSDESRAAALAEVGDPAQVLDLLDPAGWNPPR